MKAFYQNGLRFSCRQCSRCCRHESGYVYVSASDLLQLLNRFKISREDFAERYCRWVEVSGKKRVLCLKEKSNYDCIFWNNGCEAYDARPTQCALFPFWEWNLYDSETWKQAAENCPGINSGELFDTATIDSMLEAYVDNTPLTREDFYT